MNKRLRELLIEHMQQCFPDNYDAQCVAADAAMNAIAEYDSCFAKAAEKREPTFTLRAQDVNAAHFVHLWANALFYDNPEKARGAWAIADAMYEWPGRRLPD